MAVHISDYFEKQGIFSKYFEKIRQIPTQIRHGASAVGSGGGLFGVFFQNVFEKYVTFSNMLKKYPIFQNILKRYPITEIGESPVFQNRR